MDIRPTIDGELGDDMARVASQSSYDKVRVASYVERFRAVVLDRAAFERVLAALGTDTAASPRDIAEIALAYRGGGLRPTSRRAAIAAIEKRFLELIRNSNQIKQAAKSRPW